MVYLIRRFFAFYLDSAIVAVLSIIIYSLFQLTVYKCLFDQEILLILQFTFTILYYSLFDFFLKKTIGKIIFKLEVEGFENISGLKLMKKIIIRILSRFIPFEPISIFFNEEHYMWHDTFSKTTIVDKRKKK